MTQKETNVNQFNKFLQNNEDFLSQKFHQYFKKKAVLIKDFKNQAAIKFIYDVFSFSKYEADDKMNKTLKKSLTTNINDFLKILTEGSKKGAKLEFNLKNGVELLKYCIQNNEMFAVKYDKKDKKIKTQDREEQNQPEQPTPPLQEHKEVDQENKSEEENQQNPAQNQEIEYLENTLQESKLNNEFQMTRQEQKIMNPNLVKKNLKEMFEFYCRQQQNVGVNATFDRINQECHTMTLGKFMSFAIASGIKNEKIDKNLLMRKYKLTAEGRKQIDFQKFYQLIRILADIDESLIPKLGVDEKNIFKNKMKERYYAFNTKDTSFRELKKPHIFIPQLTGHSGKLSDALAEELKNRKQTRIATSLMRKPSKSPQYLLGTPQKNNRYQHSRLESSQIYNPSQLISPKELAASKVRDFNEDIDFLEKMINVEEGDEEWLKDYKLNKQVKHPVSQPIKGGTTFLPMIHSNKKSSQFNELERSDTRQSINIRKRLGFQYGNSRRERSSLA